MTIRKPAFLARGHDQQKIHLCNLHYLVLLSEGDDSTSRRFFSQDCIDAYMGSRLDLVFQNIHSTNTMYELLPATMQELVESYITEYWHEQSPNLQRIKMCQCEASCMHFYEIDPTNQKNVSPPMYSIEAVLLSISDAPDEKPKKKKKKGLLGRTSEISPSEVSRITSNFEVGVVPEDLLERPEQVLSNKLKYLYDKEVPLTRDAVYERFLKNNRTQFPNGVKPQDYKRLLDQHIRCHHS